ncbi:hypothetical protein L6164_037157 [Bauhinia variegata]|uniref:Uncharacterized protein n=1 Tax=Bauhinia variegata TaxID=167791 RepID=A0ACB9KJ80_BAUVA|nr:hypothetical protein L6164_037157 [Bauhinia variegata]
MVSSMEIEIISKETIKPSFPTSQNLRICQLSYLDQMMIRIHVPIIFFYLNNSHCIDQPDNAAKSQHLKGSLSEVLTHFYPLAGRFKDNAIIECNDAGVEFAEARVHGFLSDLLEKPDLDSLLQFVPCDVMPSNDITVPLLHVQANFFKCGSLALAVSTSHKFSDASTASTFFKCWSAIALGCMDESMLPKFVVGTTINPSMDSSTVLPPVHFNMPPNCPTTRFIFEESKITELKTRVTSAIVPKPTRVEAVTALLWKCANAARRTNLGLTTRPSAMAQAVNIRKRVSPPLSENSVGNLFATIVVSMEEGELDLARLVIQIREVLDVYNEDFLPRLLRDQNAFSKILGAGNQYSKILDRDDIDFYIFTSWCKLSFYDTDFGWGKPVWFTIPSVRSKNTMILKDTSDGKGIEALITLSAEDMAELKSNKEVLEFASVNPRVA